MASEQISRIILLTSPEDAPPLVDLLRVHSPGLDIVVAHDKTTLEETCARATSGSRLIAFCSSVIVPATALAALPGPSYNFHPGPPTRPGRYPSVFGLYDGDPKFGVTIHEMAPKVDSGAIVAVEWFDMPADCNLLILERKTYDLLISVFRKLSKHLATDRAPLPHKNIAWSGRKTTFAEAKALAQITPDMDDAEIARRRRACGVVARQDKDPGWPV